MADLDETTSSRPSKLAEERTKESKYTKAAEKSTRVSHACELCREKRARCNGERPTCQRCTKLGLECVYGLAKNDRRKKEIEDLHLRIARYEGLLEGISPSLDDETRDIFATLRQESIGSDSAIKSDPDPSPAPNIGSGTASSQLKSPQIPISGEVSSSRSTSAPLGDLAKQTPLPPSHTSTSQVGSADQSSPTQTKPSNVFPQAPTMSLNNSVMEWQRGFIYTATEGVIPPRPVTERAIQAFFDSSLVMFEFFEREEMDYIFRTVYDTQPSPERTIALCQICITAAVGCQYDWDQFPDDTGKSYLAVAKLYLEEIIESHALSAMRVMALLGLYFTFEKRVSSLVYIESGLSIARAQKIDIMGSSPKTVKWKRIWNSLVFLGCWISATICRSPDQVNQNFHASMLEFGGSTTSMVDIFQLERCKVAVLTERVLRNVYLSPSVDTNMVNMYKTELESWFFSLPSFMRIESLLNSGSHEIPMRPVFTLHLLYLTGMSLMYRRILSEFAERPESLISNTTMEAVKNHLDACLWSSRQVSRILNVAMLNGEILRKCWMFIHAAYCANNILLYFAANKFLQNPNSESIADDIRASEQCIRTLEFCAVGDESALQFLKHVKPLHVALEQMHLLSQARAPRDVVPIDKLIAEYLEAPRPKIPVGDDLAQMQRTIVNIIETLLQSPEQRSNTNLDPSAYPDPETGIATYSQSRSASASLQKYFWDDSLGRQMFQREM